MDVYTTKWVGRFTRRHRISAQSLVAAVRRAEAGSIDAELGSGLIKQRVARPNEGRSGGFRMLAAFRAGSRAVFIFGFVKNERENVGPDELASLKQISMGWLEASAELIAAAMNEGELQEVEHEADEGGQSDTGDP